MSKNVENKTRICEFCSKIIDYKITKRLIPLTNKVIYGIPTNIKWRCGCEEESQFIKTLPDNIRKNSILVLQKFNHNKFEKNEKSKI